MNKNQSYIYLVESFTIQGLNHRFVERPILRDMLIISSHARVCIFMICMHLACIKVYEY